MPGGQTIGVLSPFAGGPYFGGIIASIARAARRRDGRVIVIQSLDAGCETADRPGPREFHHHVAWRYTAGFVVIIDAVDRDYLESVRAAGKPVVVVGHDFPESGAPTVVPDNAHGVRQAVEHLIGHGHRRIAFLGHLETHDVAARHRAYLATLAAHGIGPDPRLCYRAVDNQSSGVGPGTAAMLADGVPFTALVAATDANAVGAMRVLDAAGYPAPGRIAVVGFDDMEVARYSLPSLSTVRQPFSQLGELAYRLLAAQLRGEAVPPGRHVVPTSFVVRESCGCSAIGPIGTPGSAGTTIATGATGAAGTTSAIGTARGSSTAADPVMGPDRETLAAGLAEILGLDPGPPRRPEATHGTGRGPGQGGTDRVSDRVARSTTILMEAVDAIVAAVVHATRDDPEALPARAGRLHQALTDLDRYATVASLDEIARVVRRFAAGVAARATRPAAAVEVERQVQDILIKIAQARARGQYGSSTYFQEALSTQYVVSMELLRSDEQNPRALAWLSRTAALGGCLGLWTEERPAAGTPGVAVQPSDAPEGELEIVGTYLRDRSDAAPAAGSSTVSRFPPEEMIALADETGDAAVFVIPVKSGTRDRGMLAVVGTIESAVQSGRETTNQWAALLNVALEHEEVLRSLRQQEDRLRKVALYDELTGLPNRVLFLERLRQAMRRMRRRPDYRFAVLFLDLDGFKVVNDSLGHSAGDRLLIQVAARLRDTLRDVDTAARFGGDEFLILVEDLDDVGAPLQVADRLHGALAAPFRVARQDLVVTASIGIALGSARYDDAEEILRDADIAMYTAKSREKGSHAIFDVAMHARAVSRMRIEAELRLAVEQGELEVFYQPIVDLATARPAGFEALLRWRHPDRGLIAPGEFLAVAEESGLLVPIGRLVLGEACRQLNTWQTAGLAGSELRMSVNVSNGQFWHGGLLDDIDESLRGTRLSPRHLALEITEGVVMHNVELACKLLEDLHGRGVELHIDDFGTGYSSLEALHQLPIDALKIDRSFVARLDVDPRSRELVRTIVGMGGNLGMAVIAEGIETPRHHHQLRDLGTGYGQGYWFSRPVPAEEAGALLALGPLPAPRADQGPARDSAC